MRMRRKKWVMPYLENENIILLKDKKQFQFFNDFKIKYLEIGCGLGDFITESAKQNPDILYIGYEKDPTCVANCIKKTKELGLTNLFFINDNANNISIWFEDVIFDGIYLLFSDPWKKSGYYKRRLTYRDFLNRYDKILAKEGFIYFKTDNQNLYEFSLEEFNFFKLNIIHNSKDFHKEFKSTIFTGYEKKFMAENMNIYYILAKK